MVCQVLIHGDFALKKIQNYPNDNAKKCESCSKWIKDINISISDLRKKYIIVPVNFNERRTIMRQ